MSAANIVVLAGLVIGLVYGAVGLLSGFCMMSSLRGWWAEGDGRLVRTYALAMGWRWRDATIGGSRACRYRQVDLSATVVLGAADVLGGLLFGYVR
jgi:hypothetical protein